jgi:hypothetical protein
MKKTGDEAADSMFDEIVETRILPDGSADVRLVNDPRKKWKKRSPSSCSARRSSSTRAQSTRTQSAAQVCFYGDVLIGSRLPTRN